MTASSQKAETRHEDSTPGETLCQTTPAGLQLVPLWLEFYGSVYLIPCALSIRRCAQGKDAPAGHRTVHSFIK